MKTRTRARTDHPNHNDVVFPSFSTAFWAQAEVGGPDDCWLWQGARAGPGYGKFRGSYAHRLAYELAVGPIPDGLFICHHCDNRRCVNPRHLFVGTQADNLRDMWAKGRGVSHPPRGERVHWARLDTAAVREIRELYFTGTATQKQLAQRFQVVPTTINAIVRGRNWRHVGGPIRVDYTRNGEREFVQLAEEAAA